MTMTRAPNADGRTRPPIVRIAHRWYSWAGLGLTVVVAYLAANGTLRLGDGSPLRAAGPDPINWKPPAVTADAFRPAPPGAETEPRPSGLTKRTDPAVRPVSAFAASRIASPAETPEVKKPVASRALPDAFAASAAEVKPILGGRVAPVLDAYVKDNAVVPALSISSAPPPKVTPPPIPVSPSPPGGSAKADNPGRDPDLPRVPLASADRSMPDKLPPLLAPAVRAPRPTSSQGTMAPPIPPPPPPAAPEPKGDGQQDSLPTVATAGLAETQDVEVIRIPPRQVGKADENPPSVKQEPPPRKRKLLGKLSQDDEIRLSAAQNAVRLGDFKRAAALMAEVLARNPGEYDLRAEYAGILLAAGEPDGAVRELEQVVKAAPTSAAYRVQLGDALMAGGKFRPAADVINSALDLVGRDPKQADRLPEIAVRAARAFALDHDFARAADLLERHLSGIRPDDPRAPAAMGALLLDLDRPYDALPYLIEKRKQLLASPEATEENELKVLEVLANMARGFARTGDRQQALDAIKEMAQRAPNQTAIREALGDILFELNKHELAGHVYNQVLAVDPAHGPALIGVARVYLETFRPAAAKQILHNFVPNPASQRVYLITYAGYHQSVGEYTEAKQIYRELLRRDENDHEVRFALGRLYDVTSEWEKAKAEFAKIPPQDPVGRRARLWFGFALLHQRKFAEAAQAAGQFVRDDPHNPDAAALFVRALAKVGQFDQAVQAGRGFVAAHPRDERGSATVRLAVGRALLEANRNLDAAREFEAALSRPAGRVPEAYYGLLRAAERLGRADRARQIIDSLCGPVGGDIRTRVILADFYFQDFEDHKAIEIISSIVRDEGQNLALLVRLADAQQRLARWSGNPSEAFATAQAILQRSPTNIRGQLVMARSFAVAQDFRKAVAQYDQLIAIDPEYTIPPRERARVLFSDRQYSAARTQYKTMLSPTPEEQTARQMDFLARRDARLQQAFGPRLAANATGLALRAELARLVDASPHADVRLAAHRLVCDYDATVAWQEAIRLERDAKELKDYRNYLAIPHYEAANQFEPTNTETLFDLGQVYGALGMTRASLTWYSNTLAVDPMYRDAVVAGERAAAEISPKLDVRADFFRQRGRDGLAAIDRQRYLSAVSLPLGDEDEFVQLGYVRIGYKPLDDPQLWGHAPFARVQKKWDDNRLMTYAQVNLEQYRDGAGFSTRPTFDLGYWYDHDDVLRTRGGAFLENVAECGESIRQDIYRYGVYCGTDVRPTRVWRFGGVYSFAHYSDDNDAHQALLYNDVSLSLPPKQLKLVQRVNLWGFREQSVFPTPVPDPYNLRGTVHPYFAPDCFSSFECRVEWWHWVSRDYSVHSNQCWYSVQYGIATDNDLVTYHNFRALFNFDVNSCLTIGAEAQALNSSAYDMYSAMVYLQFRFLGQ
jgi:tetratricopeptide (TPR) repeat protein